MRHHYQLAPHAPFWAGYACHECRTYPSGYGCRGWHAAYALGPQPRYEQTAVMLCPDCWKLAKEASRHTA